MSGTAERLRQSLDQLVGDLVNLITSMPVVRDMDPIDSEIVYISPDYRWGEPTPEQRAAQIRLLRAFDSLSERIRLLIAGAPEELSRSFDDADLGLRKWLELDSNWELTGQPADNETAVRQSAQGVYDVLDVLERVGTRDCFLVPDTNALLKNADPTAYRSVVAEDRFAFTLVPTVLGELDRLKVGHRNPDVRDKSEAVIRRVKGWRLQGSLHAGVTVDGTITVRALHAEPDMANTLSWLDARVEDDRIIASVLALQAQEPGARVVLVTSDINLLNKADAAMIETAEAP